MCDMIPTAHTPIDRKAARRPVVAGTALAVTLIISPMLGSTRTVADGDVAEHVAPDMPVLNEPVSWLLDGRAFGRAVDEAIESFMNGSALLDRFQFAEAVARALDAGVN